MIDRNPTPSPVVFVIYHAQRKMYFPAIAHANGNIRFDPLEEHGMRVDAERAAQRLAIMTEFAKGGCFFVPEIEIVYDGKGYLRIFPDGTVTVLGDRETLMRTNEQ